MKVLIVKTSALGDIVHALPVLTYLRSVNRDLEIDWLLENSFAPLLEGHEYLRNIYRVDTKLWRQPNHMSQTLVSFKKLISALRRQNYDVCLDLQGNMKSGFFTLLSGARWRYGFDTGSARERPNLLATNRRVFIRKADHHISDRALRIAKQAFPGGSLEPHPKVLKVDPATFSKVREKLRNYGHSTKKLVLIHPGTTWKTKRLSSDFWVNLATELCKDDGKHLILSWGNEIELLDLRVIQKRISKPLTIWPRSSLREFMALLAQVDLVIGGDTGPLHIAAALGTPTVSSYRATDRLRNGPRGDRHATFQSWMQCSPCLLKVCPENECCSDSFNVHEVFEAAHSILSKDL